MENRARTERREGGETPPSLARRRRRSPAEPVGGTREPGPTAAQGYCTGCGARVSVREGRCLLGHPVVADATTRRSSGRHAAPASTRPREHAATPAPESSPTPPPAPSRSTPPLLDPRRGSTPATPTTGLIATLWEATDPAGPVEGWTLSDDASVTVARGEVGHRRTRRGVVGIVILLVGAVVAVASTLPARQLEQQAEALSAGFESLHATLASLGPVAEDLSDGTLAEPSSASLAAARLADEARTLFTLTEQSDDEGARLRGADSATRAGTLATSVADTVAYNGLIATLLDAPELPVAVDPSDVPSVVADVAWWVTNAASVAESLPDSDPITKEDARSFAAWLDTWQPAYLDGITAGDVAAATNERTRLLSRIDELARGWKETVAATGDAALTEIAALTDQPD